ncbi:MAG: 50S ribosomal protein L11 methyltransferase [Robiginitalea sp.]|nr:50S ribosomal protein L11 methyltransferase [Robiginitalea sp.]
MRYLRCTLEFTPVEPAREIFIAALAELGFESFEETQSGLNAFIQEPLWDEAAFRALPYLKNPDWEVSWDTEWIEPRNWNAEWERDYDPIRVRDLCVVRAPFHPSPEGIPYDIVIAPKMSFGTGHHQTTFLMLDYLLDMDLEGTSVLDVGSGTGVLAILAGMKGAAPITAIDIDPWAFENCRENTVRNAQEGIEVLQGEVGSVRDRRYEVVLANINKNVLLEDLKTYARVLKEKGILVSSGFYRKDLPDLQKTASHYGLYYQDCREQDEWTAARFLKNSR